MLVAVEEKIKGFEIKFQRCDDLSKQLWKCQSDLAKDKETIKGKNAEIESLRQQNNDISHLLQLTKDQNTKFRQQNQQLVQENQQLLQLLKDSKLYKDAQTYKDRVLGVLKV